MAVLLRRLPALRAYTGDKLGALAPCIWVIANRPPQRITVRASATLAEESGIRLVYEVPRRFTLGALRARRRGSPTDTKPKVDLMLEGSPAGIEQAKLEELVQQIRTDAREAVRQVMLQKLNAQAAWKIPRVSCLSLVLCDNAHIQMLNNKFRGKDYPTDVLSFELSDDLEYKVHLPMKLMGDLVISLDMARQQASERGYGLLDEVRVLLVHGLLHLVGYDHERGPKDHALMAQQERELLQTLGWAGQGLIAAADAEVDEDGDSVHAPAGVAARSGGAAPAEAVTEGKERRQPPPPAQDADSGFLWRIAAGGSGSGSEPSAPESVSRKQQRAPGSGGSSSSSLQNGAQRQAQQRTWEASTATTGHDKRGDPRVGDVAARKGQSGAAPRGTGDAGREARQADGGNGKGSSGSSSRGGNAAQSAAGASTGAGKGAGKQQRGDGRQAKTPPPPPPAQAGGSKDAGASGRGGGGGKGGVPPGKPRVAAFWLQPCICHSLPSAPSPSPLPGASGIAPYPGTGCSSSSGSSSKRLLACRSVPEGAARAAAAADAAGDSPTILVQRQRRRRGSRQSDIELVALDLDGTLLNSSSRILDSSVRAIKAAAAAGVTVVAATGKARPAAIAAAAAAGLAEPGLLVWPEGPGVFLQGLAVHGRDGAALSDAALPPEVVQEAFRYAEERGVSLCAFLGDSCATLRMTPELRALHDTYYEPLAQVLPSAEALLAGPPVRKLLFMTTPEVVRGELLPHWEAALQGRAAQVMQAVPNMLEVVPAGVNKWGGVLLLLDHLGLPPGVLMAVGDGGNDLEMVQGAGLGVAMGNAVPAVRAAARAVVAGHDEGGVAEAFERFVL